MILLSSLLVLAMIVSTAAVLLDLRQPRLVVQGERDALGPVATVADLVARMAPPARLVRIPGADHSLGDAADLAGKQVAAFARETCT